MALFSCSSSSQPRRWRCREVECACRRERGVSWTPPGPVGGTHACVTDSAASSTPAESKHCMVRAAPRRVPLCASERRSRIYAHGDRLVPRKVNDSTPFIHHPSVRVRPLHYTLHVRHASFCKQRASAAPVCVSLLSSERA